MHDALVDPLCPGIAMQTPDLKAEALDGAEQSRLEELGKTA